MMGILCPPTLRIVASMKTAPALFGLYMELLHSIQRKGVLAKAQKITLKPLSQEAIFCLCFVFFLLFFVFL